MKRFAVLFVLLLLSLPACIYDATEAHVRLDTDVPASSDFAITIRTAAGSFVDGGGEVQRWLRRRVRTGQPQLQDAGFRSDARVSSLEFPATYAIVPPAANREQQVTVAFEAEVGPDVPGSAPLRFRRTVRFTFVPRTRIQLNVFLSVACVGSALGCTSVRASECTVSALCEERGLTCGNDGQCVPIDIVVGHDAGGQMDVPPSADVTADRAIDSVALDTARTDAGPDARCSRLACDDGVFCNGVETCEESRGCVAGMPPSCDDGIACTADSCPASGCVHSPENTRCVDSPGGTCDPVNDCQYPICNTTTCRSTGCASATCMAGTCVRTPMCTSAQMCCADRCVPSGCNDGNECTTDSCDDATGCVNAANTNVCDDGNACTTPDRCAAGTCSGATLSCDDGIACTVDTCMGACMHRQDSTLCNTGESCTASGCCSESPCRFVAPQCGCRAGNACLITTTTGRICEPAGLFTEGQACPGTTASSCTAGDVCGYIGEIREPGVCSHYCNTDADCTRGPGSLCIVPLSGVAGVLFCSGSCEPATGTGCPAGHVCKVWRSSRYYTDCINNPGPGTQGSACSSGSECGGGYTCAGGVCRHWCNRATGAGCPGATACSYVLSTPAVFGSTTYDLCQ